MLLAASRILWSGTRKSIPIEATRGSHSIRSLATSSGGSNDDKDGGSKDSDNVEDDDSFLMEGFETQEEEEEDLDATIDLLSKSDEDITPELASDLVAKMVEATKKKLDKPRHGGNIIPHISAHTVSVMRASRITTNNITAAGSDYLPHAIEKRVSAEVNVEQLNLSRTAEEALKILSGPRWKGSYIKLSSDRFPSMEENRAHIVSQIDRLVAAAMKSVGDNVDAKPLTKWPDVVGEVARQAKEEIQEAGNVSLVLGEAKV